MSSGKQPKHGSDRISGEEQLGTVLHGSGIAELERGELRPLELDERKIMGRVDGHRARRVHPRRPAIGTRQRNRQHFLFLAVQYSR